MKFTIALIVVVLAINFISDSNASPTATDGKLLIYKFDCLIVDNFHSLFMKCVDDQYINYY